MDGDGVGRPVQISGVGGQVTFTVELYETDLISYNSYAPRARAVADPSAVDATPHRARLATHRYPTPTVVNQDRAPRSTPRTPSTSMRPVRRPPTLRGLRTVDADAVAIDRRVGRVACVRAR